MCRHHFLLFYCSHTRLDEHFCKACPTPLDVTLCPHYTASTICAYEACSKNGLYCCQTPRGIKQEEVNVALDSLQIQEYFASSGPEHDQYDYWLVRQSIVFHLRRGLLSLDNVSSLQIRSPGYAKIVRAAQRHVLHLGQIEQADVYNPTIPLEQAKSVKDHVRRSESVKPRTKSLATNTSTPPTSEQASKTLKTPVQIANEPTAPLGTPFKTPHNSMPADQAKHSSRSRAAEVDRTIKRAVTKVSQSAHGPLRPKIKMVDMSTFKRKTPRSAEKPSTENGFPYISPHTFRTTSLYSSETARVLQYHRSLTVSGGPQQVMISPTTKQTWDMTRTSTPKPRNNLDISFTSEDAGAMAEMRGTMGGVQATSGAQSESGVETVNDAERQVSFGGMKGQVMFIPPPPSEAQSSPLSSPPDDMEWDFERFMRSE
ncbi:hypothetical protein K461DRAFT_322002 [Myriangium duriaei CBS 260.36]|uniref:Uncharacterized protein n=1 Tax=Myriangium duriaei CBS 260.36 TaxID=1168546 RepID=A0A9P4J0H9_9PEZI|nr:hypothetical protein K461DRAFT_322002 [Myriangium duriaei CBS 260.36]